MKDTELVIISKTDLDRLREIEKKHNGGLDPELLNRRKNQRDTAKWIGVSEPTLIAWRRKGLIPFEQILGTKKIWFNLANVKNALDQKKPKPSTIRGKNKREFFLNKKP